MFNWFRKVRYATKTRVAMKVAARLRTDVANVNAKITRDLKDQLAQHLADTAAICTVSKRAVE